MLERYPCLETERLILKPLQSSDAAQIQRLFPRWEIVRHLSGKVPWPYPDDGARQFIERVALPQIAAGTLLMWSLRLKGQPDALIGVIHLALDSEKNRGFWLAPEWQGHGYMTEATEAVTAYWFTQLKQKTLRTIKCAENIGSRRISERTGMHLVGRTKVRYVGGDIKDADIWEISRDEWVSHLENI